MGSGVRRARAATQSVLLTDVALHGRRFIAIEFKFAAGISAVLAALIAAIGSGWAQTAIGVAVFAEVSVNSWWVVRWVSHYEGPGERTADVWNLALFAALTLIPGALAAAIGSPRVGGRRGRP